MEQTNINTLYQSDFFEPDFFDESSLSRESQAYTQIWWVLAVIEMLLTTKLILEYFEVNLTNTFTYLIYTTTSYIEFPFANTLTDPSMDNSFSWQTIISIAGYFLLTLALIEFLKAIRSPHSRIEQARALSRRKYSH